MVPGPQEWWDTVSELDSQTTAPEEHKSFTVGSIIPSVGAFPSIIRSHELRHPWSIIRAETK